MKKLLIALSLVTSAALSSAAVDRVASYDGDAFVGGVDVVSTSGTVNIEWDGYEAPYYGRTAWRVMVWEQGSNYPIANELYLASSSLRTYSRNYSVTPGRPVRVELYAAANQYWNDPTPSHNVATYMWVSPLDTTYNYQPPVNPANYQATQYYNYPLNTFTVWPNYQTPVYPMNWGTQLPFNFGLFTVQQ